jgi:ABC-type amino acid transport substrate-binding protein
VIFLAALIATTALTSRHASSAGDLLTGEEREWLANHPAIRLAYETRYPPFTFVDSQGQVRGLYG